MRNLRLPCCRPMRTIGSVREQNGRNSFGCLQSVLPIYSPYPLLQLPALTGWGISNVGFIQPSPANAASFLFDSLPTERQLVTLSPMATWDLVMGRVDYVNWARTQQSAFGRTVFAAVHVGGLFVGLSVCDRIRMCIALCFSLFPSPSFSLSLRQISTPGSGVASSARYQIPQQTSMHHSCHSCHDDRPISYSPICCANTDGLSQQPDLLKSNHGILASGVKIDMHDKLRKKHRFYPLRDDPH
ncbi:hypothetical protein BX600DRAFT_315297 [Xylariales sp. PMI_506]|nr:hypothetical protein BX600DRAFT_315297 [Xylariales sp. PMI_506]